jgi:hypothetical protein
MSDQIHIDMLELQREGSLDNLFNVISNGRRRYVLYYLYRNPGPVELRELTDQLAAYEAGVDVEDVEENETQSVYISLYQTHLPKMENAGLVEYDQDEKLIQLTERARMAAESDLGSRPDRPWYVYYGSIAGLGVVGVGALAAGVVPSGSVAWMLLTVAILALLLGVLLYQYSTRDDASCEDMNYLNVDALI